MQNQIRLLLEEQSDKVLHCLLYHLYFLEILLQWKFLFHQQTNAVIIILGVPVPKNFTVALQRFQFLGRDGLISSSNVILEKKKHDN